MKKSTLSHMRVFSALRCIPLAFFLAGGLIHSGILSAQPTEPPPEPDPGSTTPPEEEDPGDPGETPPAEDPGTPPPEVFFFLDGISTRAFIDNVNFVDPGTEQNFGIINTSVIISGEPGETQTIVWRGRGPSIDLPVPLAGDPNLNVAQVGVGSLVTNDSFLEDPNLSIIDGTPFVPGSIEEVEGIATTPELGEGAYSVRVTSDGDTEGIAIGEAFAFFEATPESEPPLKLSGISTRAPVGNGANQSMNASFIIVGEEPVDVVCRGRGPSINLPEAISRLPDPIIELVRIGEGVIASNDNFEDTPNLSLIAGTTFIPENIDPNESIIVALGLTPGAYSLRLRNVDNTEPEVGGEGIGIAEVLVADFSQ